MIEPLPGRAAQTGKRIALSGATGFVGRVVRAEAERRGYETVLAGRAELERLTGNGGGNGLLAGCAAAVHLAGRAHVLQETQADWIDEYRRVNRDMTLAFAEACVSSGVKRFVFVSSIHVNGPASVRPFRSDDPPAPAEPYARSKLEAEQGLRDLARRSGLEVVIVRPTLVYGPNAKANFLRLMRLAALPLPLPVAGVSGERSLIGVWNLADLLICCLEHPAASGSTLLAADAEDVSLPELVRLLRVGMGMRPRLFNVPEGLLRRSARMVGMGKTFDKLAGTLQVDVSETRRLLDWTPPLTVQEGLMKTARWYVESGHRARD